MSEKEKNKKGIKKGEKEEGSPLYKYIEVCNLYFQKIMFEKKIFKLPI